jgi:hypothetical protein
MPLLVTRETLITSLSLQLMVQMERRHSLLAFGDVSTGETVPLVAENSSGRGDESGVVPGKDDAMSTAATESPVKLLGTTFLFLAMQVTKPPLQARMV